ncbi:MAG: tyrosine--tRNA ligase [Chlamydiales bacterium]|nr:tyrosine--tRNA ligase [Chlamydiales bacterium]
MQTVIDVLVERGFIEAMTSEEIKTLVKTPQRVYSGFDPTGDSLHLGHLVPIMGLAWFQRFGHTPVAIVGGATGMVGDPSGKSKERNLLDQETLAHNLLGIRKNLEAILNFNDESTKPFILNNFDWFKQFSFLDFLRDVGKNFRIGSMLSKESVRVRMQSEEGLSFTEFSYQILQAYDFLYLSEHHNVLIQLGGSDQWGNITAGTELIRKVQGKSAFGITFPLLKRSDGKKFGKTEEGAVWLSSEKTSPYTFYQYLFSIPDLDVIPLMKMLTFMDMEEINHYEHKMQQSDYIANTAQKKLAEEVTRIVHGKDGLEIALKVTKGASPGSNTILDINVLENLAQDMKSKSFSKVELINVKLIDLLVKLEAVASKGEARRLIQGGGVYINNQKVIDEFRVIVMDDFIEEKMFLLSVGKKHKMIVGIIA